MQQITKSIKGPLKLLVLLLFLFSYMVPGRSAVQAAAIPVEFADIQTVYTGKVGLASPVGFAFLPAAKGFLVWDTQNELTRAQLLVNYDDAGSPVDLPGIVPGSLNAAFDIRGNRLFFLNEKGDQLSGLDLTSKGFPDVSQAAVEHANIQAYGVRQPAGLAFDPFTGRLFILDAGRNTVVSVAAHRSQGYDGAAASKNGRISRINLRAVEGKVLRGIAYNPENSRLYVSIPDEQAVYEFSTAGDLLGSMDLSNFQMTNIQSLTFAPSADQTDAQTTQHLFVLDGGSTQRTGSILELTLAPQALPIGTTLLPSTLIRKIDTSSAAWFPSSPDPSGIDYFPPTGRLILDDSEVDEMSVYAGANVYQSTLAGQLQTTCNTLSFSREPTGIAVNMVNNHIFMTDDDRKEIYEINLGPDGAYCTSDDSVTKASTVTLFGGSGSDPEDVAIGNNTLFFAGGSDAEVYYFNLGPNGLLGGGDDGPVSHFDTLALGFKDLEGIGFNHDSGTIFIVSTSSTDRYVGELTTTGQLLWGFDLSFMGSQQNIRSDVAYLPSLENPGTNNIYIASRGIDNDSGTGATPTENDGQVWVVSIGSTTPPTATPTPTDTPTATPTNTVDPNIPPTDTPTPVNTATPTDTPTSTPTPTPTPLPSSNPLYLSMASNGTIGGVAFSDEDILAFDGTAWSLHFDGSDVGVGNQDLFAMSIVDADTILMAFTGSGTVNGVAFTPRDVLQFDATSLGSVTSGTFSMFFNGVDVGLDSNGENIDSVDVLSDGRVLLSTTASTNGLPVAAVDEDILVFTPTSLGANTSGTWAIYFDGSDVGLSTNSNEDIDALDVDSFGNIYLSTLGDFAVTGVTGFDEDVFVCAPAALGSVTSCVFDPVLFFDGSTWLQDANDVDAFNLSLVSSPVTPTPTATPTDTPTVTPTNTPVVVDTPTNTPTNTPVVIPTDTPTPGPTNTPTDTPTPGPTNTPTDTSTPGPTATFTDTPTLTPTPTDTPTPTPTPEVVLLPIYISLDGSGNVGGVAADDIDILSFDGISWSMFFDASDVGINSSGQDLNDFVIVDSTTLLLTFRSTFTLGSINVDPWDILQFNAASLGSNTTGSFSLYFDGEDVGLDTTGETIDALDVQPDGTILVSVTTNASVPGLTATDEDLIAFTPTSLGDVTSGSWTLYFDGSDVGLADTSGEDLDGVDVLGNGDIFLSVLTDFSVAGLSGLNEDVFICSPLTLGDATSCFYAPSLYFDGSLWGLDTNDVDGVHIP